MSTALTRRLPELAAEITKEHELCEGGYRTALEHALKVGALLHEAKGQLGHGAWLAWLSEHTPISVRNAQQYMQLAQSPNAKPVSHLGIKDALHAIAEPREAPASPDYRQVLRRVDPAEAQAALAELGPMRQETNPPTAMMRTTLRQVEEALGRVRRSMDEASAPGLSNWSRGEALHEASRYARDAAAQLSELAASVAT